jgi:hypothetical protein
MPFGRCASGLFSENGSIQNGYRTSSGFVILHLQFLGDSFGVGRVTDESLAITTIGRFNGGESDRFAGMDALRIEADLAGNTIRAIDAVALGVKMQTAGFDFIAAYFQHDFALLPNGHVILLTNFTRNFTDLPGYPGTTEVVGDGIVDLI